MRPYIVCHMIASLDGRIDCAMVDAISGEHDYYDAQEKLDCPSRLSGRVTAEHYFAEKTPFTPASQRPAGAREPHVARPSAAYSVVVDTCGRLRWPGNELDELPLICIVGEQAPAEYLDLLREQGISYIVAGAEKIDLPKAMEELGRSFGVRRLQILGGGHINGAFLEAGLIDEVSFLLAPGIDGRAGLTAVFDGISDKDRSPVPLRLKSVEQYPSGTLWMRYEVCRTGK